MFHVIYVSTATEQLSSGQLRVLLMDSRQRNSDLGLTGLLLYAHERFLQVLEGPESAVKAVFSSIRNDSRHKNIDTLRFEQKAGRHFPDWQMGFRDLSGESATLPGVSRFLDPDCDIGEFHDESNESYRMLLAFRNASGV